MEDDDLLLALHLNETTAKLLLKSVDFFLQRWPGGDPSEQTGLAMLKTRLQGCVLEYQMRK